MISSLDWLDKRISETTWLFKSVSSFDLSASSMTGIFATCLSGWSYIVNQYLPSDPSWHISNFRSRRTDHKILFYFHGLYTISSCELVIPISLIVHILLTGADWNNWSKCWCSADLRLYCNTIEDNAEWVATLGPGNYSLSTADLGCRVRCILYHIGKKCENVLEL